MLKQLWRLIDDRTGLSNIFHSFLGHHVPPNVGWAYVLGSATLLVFIMQVMTGFALASAYIPSPAEAYDSLQFITNESRFGNLLRGMHFYGASMMVILISLHALRTFLYGAYKFPREANWLTGVILLGLTLLMAWTGQLLRWDENGYWTVFAGAHNAAQVPLVGEAIARFMLAGETVGGPTLSRFFVFHIMFLPGLIMALVAFHIYLVIRNGISEPPEPGRPVDPTTYREWYRRLVKREGIPFWPNAAWRDAVAGAFVALVVILLALIFGAIELGGPPDPTRLQVEPRPDWYFRWYDALVTLALPQLERTVMLWLPLLGWIILLLLPFLAHKGERSPWRRPWAVLAVIFLLVAFGWLTFASRHERYIPEFTVEPLPAEVVGVTGGPVAEGAQLFYDYACLYCHAIDGRGGLFGPDLTHVADRMQPEPMRAAILLGSPNMPAYVDSLTLDDFEKLMAFLESRRR